MRDNHWQHVLVFGAHMNEVDVEPVNFGDEILNRVDLRFAFAPIVMV